MIVQSLWIGKLTNLEKMCIKSFLLFGNEFHLYTYDPIEEIPEGTIVKDANEIMPREQVFTLKEQYLPFSDIWRYNLLAKKGGVWVDLDMVCMTNLEPLQEREYIFSSERTIQKGSLQFKDGRTQVPNIGFLKAPANSAFYIELCAKCNSIQQKGLNTDKIRYMRVLREMIEKYNYQHYVMPPQNFCNVDWWYAKDLFFKDNNHFKEKYGVPWLNDFNECYTLHLWRNLATHKYGLDLNSNYPTHSLYYQLSSLFL
jgi:hypothetical protein